MSGLGSGFFWLSTMSNVEFSESHPPGSCFSIHLSGMVNGFTQVIAFAGDTSAVATASMFTWCTLKACPISVPTGLPRSAVRYTCTRTRLLRPDGESGNVTSPGCTSTSALMTSFSFAAVIALWTAGPPAERLS